MRRLLILSAMALALSLSPGAAFAEHHEAAENPCAAKADNPCGAEADNPCNPCAAKVDNPCNPCAATDKPEER